MILDTLANSDTYCGLNPLFTKAFNFLRNNRLKELKTGRHEIDGDSCYAIVAKENGRGKKSAKLEAHRKYIDIQFLIAGTETIGWMPVPHCIPDSDGYNDERDLMFYANEPDNWLTLSTGMFAVFFPDDAHAPLVSTGVIHKAVVKVAVVALKNHL